MTRYKMLERLRLAAVAGAITLPQLKDALDKRGVSSAVLLKENDLKALMEELLEENVAT